MDSEGKHGRVTGGGMVGKKERAESDELWDYVHFGGLSKP